MPRKGWGWMVLKESDWKKEESKVAEPLCGKGGQRGILFFPFLPLLLTFPRSSFCSCTFDLLPFLRSSTLIHSLRRRAKKRMYFSSIHCAVVMTTTILDNLPPLEDMSSVISGHFISHFDEKIVINKKCIQGGNKYIYISS